MARNRKGLSAEDKALWKQVAASATPMHASKSSPTLTENAPAKPQPRPKPAQKRPLSSFQIGQNATPHDPGHHLTPSVAERINEAPVRMHRGTYQKMQRGKLKPEAKIDLHGMTLSRAHPELIDFMMRAHAKGARLVLVITGKGRDRDEDGPIPIRRGILRHQVPAWLAAPPLGQIVLDIRTAHLRHGGEGAYYVYLKRMR